MKLFVVVYVAIYQYMGEVDESELTEKVCTTKKQALEEFKNTKKEILSYYRGEKKAKVTADVNEKEYFSASCSNGDRFTITLEEIDTDKKTSFNVTF